MFCGVSLTHSCAFVCVSACLCLLDFPAAARCSMDSAPGGWRDKVAGPAAGACQQWRQWRQQAAEEHTEPDAKQRWQQAPEQHTEPWPAGARQWRQQAAEQHTEPGAQPLQKRLCKICGSRSYLGRGRCGNPRCGDPGEAKNVCLFFQAGSCSRGTKCRFPHTVASRGSLVASQVACSFHQIGRCKFGGRCWFVHAAPSMPSADEAAFLQASEFVRAAEEEAALMLSETQRSGAPAGQQPFTLLEHAEAVLALETMRTHVGRARCHMQGESEREI